MQTFTYTALNHNGNKEETGSITAENEYEAKQQLFNAGKIVSSIYNSTQQKSLLNRNISFSKTKISMREKENFLRDLARSLGSGIVLIKALQFQAKKFANKKIGFIIADIVDKMSNDGSSFSKTLLGHKESFGSVVVAVLQAGEASGELDQACLRAADYMGKRLKLRNKVIGSLIYPTIILNFAFFILMIMAFLVVPIFKGIYKSLNGHLPFITQELVTLTSSFVSDWYLFILVLAIIGILILRVRTDEVWRRWYHKNILKLPYLGTLLAESATARIATTLSVLIDSGVTILIAIEMSYDVAGNLIYRDALENIYEALKDGKSITEIVRNAGFPEDFIYSIATGEESGKLPDALSQYGKQAEERIEFITGSLLQIIEPIAIVFVGLLVGSFIIILYLPMFDYINLVKS